MSWRIGASFYDTAKFELLEDDQIILVSYDFNVADEFDTGGFELFTVREWKEHIARMSDPKQEWYGRAGYFGNLEGPDISDADDLKSKAYFTLLTEGEASVIRKLFGSYYGNTVEIEFTDYEEEPEDTEEDDPFAYTLYGL